MPGAIFATPDAQVLNALPATSTPQWPTAGTIGARCGMTVEEAVRVLARLRDTGLVARSEGWPTRYALMPVLA